MLEDRPGTLGAGMVVVATRCHTAMFAYPFATLVDDLS